MLSDRVKELKQKFPQLTCVYFESEWEYDDEGGYAFTGRIHAEPEMELRDAPSDQKYVYSAYEEIVNDSQLQDIKAWITEYGEDGTIDVR